MGLSYWLLFPLSVHAVAVLLFGHHTLPLPLCLVQPGAWEEDLSRNVFALGWWHLALQSSVYLPLQQRFPWRTE